MLYLKIISVLDRISDDNDDALADLFETGRVNPAYRAPRKMIPPKQWVRPPFKVDVPSHLEPFTHGNCYAFAVSDPRRIQAVPGTMYARPISLVPLLSPALVTLRSEEPGDLRKAILADGALPADERNLAPREGYYLIAAFVSLRNNMGKKDMHFYRQEPDGTWWHTAGMISNFDAQGHLITDPRQADRDYRYDNSMYNYATLVGFFYVPNEGLRPGGNPM